MNLNSYSYLLAVTNASGRVALVGTDVNVSGLDLYNEGPSLVFVKSGNSSVTVVAPIAGTPQQVSFIPPGAYVTFPKNTGDTHIAAITAAGTANLYFKAGSDNVA
jgi:hypothetical protein